MKKLFIILICFLFGCEATLTTDQIQLTREIFAAFNSHDWEKMASFYADRLEYTSPEGHFETKAEMLAYYRKMHKAFPDIQDEIITLYPSGSSVIVEFVAKATAPDGSRMELPIMGVLTFEKGKVIRDATYYDL